MLFYLYSVQNTLYFNYCLWRIKSYTCQTKTEAPVPSSNNVLLREDPMILYLFIYLQQKGIWSVS